jgi:methyl-accepting chemotaxis protein
MNEMKGMNEEMIKVIQNNTSVMNEIKDEQRELREAIQSLQQEIKDISK